MSNGMRRERLFYAPMRERETVKIVMSTNTLSLYDLASDSVDFFRAAAHLCNQHESVSQRSCSLLEDNLLHPFLFLDVSAPTSAT